MPTYEYKCPKCGREYEAIQKINDKALAKCPKCGTRGKRMISGGIGVMFKGSGFYETDYKRAGEKKSGDEGGKTEKTETSEKADKSDKPDKSGEKPADKPAEKSTAKTTDKPSKESKKKPGAES